MLAITGARMAPIRPLTEQSPTAALLVVVGNSSDVNEYIVATADEIQSFPTSERAVRISEGSMLQSIIF